MVTIMGVGLVMGMGTFMAEWGSICFDHIFSIKCYMLCVGSSIPCNKIINMLINQYLHISLVLDTIAQSPQASGSHFFVFVKKT